MEFENWVCSEHEQGYELLANVCIDTLFVAPNKPFRTIIAGWLP